MSDEREEDEPTEEPEPMGLVGDNVGVPINVLSEVERAEVPPAGDGAARDG